MLQLAGQPQQLPRVPLQAVADQLAEHQREALQRLQHLVLIRAQQFCGGGGRGGAQVGHEVGNGEISLVAHGADHWQRAAVDGPRHTLLIEGLQILKRAAAPAHDQHVQPQLCGPAIGSGDGPDDGGRRLGTLYRHG